MILVDTSVWIDHLHRADPSLIQLLERCDVVTHPLVIGELAMRSIRSRGKFLTLLSELPRVPVASHDEVMALIDAQHLHGKALGIVDAHLLASALLSPGTRMWTKDRALARMAHSMAVGSTEPGRS
jgi:predicted nucleic acid-binding protein